MSLEKVHKNTVKSKLGIKEKLTKTHPSHLEVGWSFLVFIR
jgi:hypothetical protein